MFESITKFFKKLKKNQKENSGVAAKERLHLVLAQDRANISADFLEMMKQEIIEVIKKYIDIDEEAIDVRMTNKPGEDGTVGAPALYANIPIVTIKNDARKLENKIAKHTADENKEEKIEENNKEQTEKQPKSQEETQNEEQNNTEQSSEKVNEEEKKEETISNTENDKEDVKEVENEKKDS